MFDDELEISFVSQFNSVQDTFTVDCFGLFRPVKNLIFFTWTRCFPDQYPLWRLTTIVAFLGLIPIVYQFFGLFFRDQPWLRLMTTALWAAAPTMTSVVFWTSGTNIIVGGYGFFLYFLLSERSQKLLASEKIEMAYAVQFVSLICLAFACFSYEAAMAAPFLLLLKTYVQHWDRLREKRTWIFFFLSLFTLSLYFILREYYGGVTNFVIRPTLPAESDLWVSLSSGWMFLVHALRWLWPFGHQGMLIVFSPEANKTLVVVAAVAVFSLGIGLFLGRKKWPTVFLSLGWYALALLPMSNVIPLRNGPICDYYLFLPSIGLALFVVHLTRTEFLIRVRKAAVTVVPLLTIAFVLTTHQWAPHWKSKQALAERTLDWQPNNFVVLGTLANESAKKGDLTAATSYIDKALKIAPWFAPLSYEKALILIAKEQFDESVLLLEKLTQADQNAAKPFVMLAYVLDTHLNQIHRAEQLLATAMEKPWDDHYSKTGALNLAKIYLKTGRQPFALQIYQSLLERYPTDEHLQEIYANAQSATGRL